MIKIVDEAECRRYRSDCSITLKRVCSMLKEKGITAQFIKAPNEYRNDLRHLKDTVRVLLDKAAGLWLDVREQYVRLKEMYLTRCWDKDHPSFIVYIEAVNNVYHQYFD